VSDARLERRGEEQEQRSRREGRGHPGGGVHGGMLAFSAIALTHLSREFADSSRCEIGPGATLGRERGRMIDFAQSGEAEPRFYWSERPRGSRRSSGDQ
jgi:hypothetical protein